MGMHADKLATFLWFESRAAEAAALYCRIFPDARITGSGGGTTTLELAGQRFILFEGGPHFQLTAAVSIFVPCADQAAVDALWEQFLAAGSSESRCGWLVDPFGLSWQIIPTRLLELLNDPDPGRRQRAQAAMMTQVKIEIAAIERAAATSS